ncbi:MAG: asparagine synthase (glutamine-hydrolyzing) [Lachnospiraceae bacterium]|nr:asparagine synthase (glutamine-hydrolyzing) [Lachnospiraceae bacterium]
MCGIAGFCNGAGNWKQNIERMNEKMYHRGPDASGIWSSEDHSVTLGHRRLAIIDLTPSGAQPMESADGRYVIAYNGEIYNYIRLKERLLREQKVTAFKGTSDTEVLLEAVSAYGLEETLKMAKGMFAIALYDKEKRELFLARDRVGEKPLYYGFVGEKENNRCFVFASDLNSITALEGFENPVNTEVLENYFRYGYIAAPYSVYENIWKLEPGKILKIKSPFNNFNIKSYWSMEKAALYGQNHLFVGSEEEAARELERILKEAIREQMTADVPVGAFLSAGIDSSTVVSLMQSLSSRKVRSFTIGMWDEKFNEADTAAQIARILGTEHTELYITEEDAKGVIPGLAGMFGEPFADSSQIPTYLVSKMTREHVTVSLSGDGGDELFCGYGTYTSIDRIWKRTRQIPYPVRKPVSAALGAASAGRHGALSVKARLLGARSIEDMYLRSEIGEGFRIVRKDLKQRGSRQTAQLPWEEQMPWEAGRTVMDTYPSGLMEEPLHNLMLMDLRMYHPDDILNKVDRTAMAVSLETRVPMLDKDVVEFAWTLPLAYRMRDGVTKKVLRDILYQYVPQELMERPKKGFSIPLHKWLKETALREWAESLIDRQTLDRQGLLDTETVWRLWRDYTERDIWRVQIWYILMFQEWMRYTGR